MLAPPDPKRLRAAPLSTAPKSQNVISNTEHSQGQLDLQAWKLRRLFFLAESTARVVSEIAWGLAR
jgi:hypothetical protein